MIELEDPMWKHLRGGRHLMYDASVSLRALEAAFGVRLFNEEWSKELACSILAVVAFAKGLPRQGRVLIELTDDELDEFLDVAG
jgi:hypothetical protein